MKTITKTVIERIGENMGPIPWDHPWIEYESYPCNPEIRLEKGRTMLEMQDLLAAGFVLRVHEDSMISKVLLEVGMYDGWPYWKPYPSFCTRASLGGIEWHSWTHQQGYTVMDIYDHVGWKENTGAFSDIPKDIDYFSTVEIYLKSGERVVGLAYEFTWQHNGNGADITFYRTLPICKICGDTGIAGPTLQEPGGETCICCK